MILRAATDADLPALAAILGAWNADTAWMPKLHGPEADLGFVRHLMASRVLRVAGDPPQGFLARLGGEVDALYLAPRARRQGLGRRLLDEAKAAEPWLTLWTFQANTAAQAFYAAQGFVEIERGDGSGNAEGLPDVRLEWRRS
jgi:ribosomal protein S18 acetylase RimI-like enzyme